MFRLCLRISRSASPSRDLGGGAFLAAPRSREGAIALPLILAGALAASPLGAGRVSGAEEAATTRLEEFRGPAAVCAGDGIVTIAWRPLADGAATKEDCRYRVYTAAKSGAQNFAAAPALETKPGAFAAILANLPRGVPVYVVVRAVDAAGREDQNETEWAATPNPVLYVDEAIAVASPDGRSPATAFRTIQAAIDSAITVEGVNIYVARGRYAENVLIFDGMMLYGGFGSDFSPIERAPAARSQIVAPAGTNDLVTVAPGDSPCGLDGFALDGGERAGRGILAEECLIRITNSNVSGFQRKGIELRSKRFADSRVEGHVRGSVVENNAGEGIFLEGNLDLEVTDTRILHNGQEGIEAKPLTVAAGEKTQLLVERCEIRDSGDIGVEVDLDRLAGGASRGGRFRVTLRDNVIAANKDHGASVDVQYPEGEEIDLQVRVIANEITGNGKSGLQLDGDATGKYEVAYNYIEGRDEHGAVFLTGDAAGAVYRFHHDVLRGGAGPALRQHGLGTVIVRDSEVAADAGREPLEVRGYLISPQPAGTSAAESPATDPRRRPHSPLAGAIGPFSAPRGAPPFPEPVEISPPPNCHVGDGTWMLRFADPVRGRIGAVLRASPGGGAGAGANAGASEIPCTATIREGDQVLEVRALAPIAPGTAVALVLSARASGSASGTGADEKEDYVLPYTAASPLRPQDGVVEELPAAGTISLAATERAAALTFRARRAGTYRVSLVGAAAGGALVRIEASKGGLPLPIAGGAFSAGAGDRVELSLARADATGTEPISVRLLIDEVRE
ncbi:MAG: right-handed parallel beta-helix repeat-containing protein [Planctomycetes bacterium]|nr:right-handed parallel beta-helix repeat-containing protein [Planctomycetota bacterium]